MRENRPEIVDEKKFIESEECHANEHGVYIYGSLDGGHHLNLPYFLLAYKEWLIDQGKLRSME